MGKDWRGKDVAAEFAQPLSRHAGPEPASSARKSLRAGGFIFAGMTEEGMVPSRWYAASPLSLSAGSTEDP
jgi:hypothetical protein